MSNENSEHAVFFRRLLDSIGAKYAVTHRHYQQIAQVDGDRVFASFVPSRQQTGYAVPFRLEWRRQTGREAALRQVQAASADALSAQFGSHLEWDYKPDRDAALLLLWYSGPEGDTEAQLEWVAVTAPQFIAALKSAVLAASPTPEK